MAENAGRSNSDELFSLNVDELDVEELERRLEMAAGALEACCWIFAGGCSGFCNEQIEPD